MIQLRNLTKMFGGVRAVADLSLTVERGELVCLLGGSGSGKTTTLKMINRLIEPTSGEVAIDGHETRTLPPYELRRGIGYVFQETGLFPFLDVAANISVTPRLLGWDGDRIAKRVDELLELLRLEPGEYRGRRPAELSGGERQRVGLARALAAEPEVLLLDEPFGALDPVTREDLQTAFQEIRRRLGLTSVFVTHDMAEALLLADRIAVLRDGALVQVGTPAELLNRPADSYIERLVATPARQAEAVETLRHAARRGSGPSGSREGGGGGSVGGGGSGQQDGPGRGRSES